MVSKFIHLESGKSQYVDSNCFNSKFILNQPIHKLRRITLKCMEIPVSFPNIRENTNTIIFVLNGINYTISILEKNYSSIYEILDAINSRLQTYQGITISFLLNSINKVYVSFTGTFPTTFSIIETNLSKWILGFRSTDSLIKTGVVSCFYNASTRFNMNIDNYITVLITNLVNENGHDNQSTFKVSFNAEYNQIFYYNEFLSYTQFVSNLDYKQVMVDMNIKILDRFGFQLFSNLDYSMTLLIESD